MFKRFFKRLSQDESELRAQLIREWVRSLPGVTPIREAQPRSIAKLAGVVERLLVTPRDGVASIEAVISDGTGQVRAVWLGRRSVRGVQLGARMIVEGRLGGDSKHLQVINPTYEFEAPEER